MLATKSPENIKLGKRLNMITDSLFPANILIYPEITHGLLDTLGMPNYLKKVNVYNDRKRSAYTDAGDRKRGMQASRRF